MNEFKFAIGQEVHSKPVGEMPYFEGRVVARFMNDQTTPKPFYHVEWLATVWHREEADLGAAS